MRSPRLPILLLFSAGILSGGAALADDPPAGAPASAPATPAAPSPQAAPGKPGYRSPVPSAKQILARSRHPKRGKHVAVWPGPIASFPGFRMLDGGGTRVFVDVDRKVDIVEQKAPGRIIFRLAGTLAPAGVNRLPILTSYFPSVVHRVQLVQSGAALDLVIDVREAVAIEHRVLDSESGIVFQVDLPKASTYDAWKAAREAPAPPVEAQAGPRARRATETTSIEGQGTDRVQSPY